MSITDDLTQAVKSVINVDTCKVTQESIGNNRTMFTAVFKPKGFHYFRVDYTVPVTKILNNTLPSQFAQHCLSKWNPVQETVVDSWLGLDKRDGNAESHFRSITRRINF